MANEGAEVRRAYDGPDIEHDKLLDFIEARNREDHQRSSSAGESRQKIGEFIESTGMNSQALSWCRTIVKKLNKSDGQTKAMDVIASLEKALPMVKAHVTGQGTLEMQFEEPPEDAPEPLDHADLPPWDADDDMTAGRA